MKKKHINSFFYFTNFSVCLESTHEDTREHSVHLNVRCIKGGYGWENELQRNRRDENLRNIEDIYLISCALQECVQRESRIFPLNIQFEEAESTV